AADGVARQTEDERSACSGLSGWSDAEPERLARFEADLVENALHAQLRQTLAYDLVPESLAELGVERVFHKVRLKPGKPLWFGIGPARQSGASRPLVFGLPGNPVSGIVGFLLFVRPALDALAARSDAVDRMRDVRLARSYVHAGERPTYHPARIVERPAPGDIPLVEPLE